MTFPIMERSAPGSSQPFPSPLPACSVFRVSPVLIPMLLLIYIPGKKNESCEFASLVLQNAFWRCLCAGMPTRKFERDPAS